MKIEIYTREGGLEGLHFLGDKRRERSKDLTTLNFSESGQIALKDIIIYGIMMVIFRGGVHFL